MKLLGLPNSVLTMTLWRGWYQKSYPKFVLCGVQVPFMSKLSSRRRKFPIASPFLSPKQEIMTSPEPRQCGVWGALRFILVLISSPSTTLCNLGANGSVATSTTDRTTQNLHSHRNRLIIVPALERIPDLQKIWFLSPFHAMILLREEPHVRQGFLMLSVEVTLESSIYIAQGLINQRH